ncbi:YoaK family protein [Streptomyces sp. CRN 30]|uniref:YoaK family protein n=1 Tax=Streptomyces sp. CRN 30 TaxID=3075613 RepID=UPI002A8160D5|nr:YoaK family protein [Streptomyces sp. CRN 30]
MSEHAERASRGRGAARRADGWATALLSSAAGAVNALGFLSLGGVFTSVVTANSALVGIGLGTGRAAQAAPAGLAVLAYVAGAAVGSRLAVAVRRAARCAPLDFLLLEAAVLWAVAGWWIAEGGHLAGVARSVALAAAAAAMGCQSGGLRVAAGSGATTAYLTGLLTGAVADAVTGRRPPRRLLVTMAPLICGAALFALLADRLRASAAVLPALLVSAAWAWARTRGREEPAAAL